MYKKSSCLSRFCIPIITLICLGLIAGLCGCSHKKTNRGHLFRCDWAFEYNRTPWIGCPPESGCDDERSCGIDGSQECSGKQGFRRHCGQSSECTPKKPCCRTLGCGMWINPSDPNSFANMNQGIKACGLTPFCSPMKPCGLTPTCGRISASPQMLMLGNGGMTYPGLPSGARPMTPTPVPNPQNTPPAPERQGTPTVAGPNGLYISMGIVPGVSMVSNGGVVAANGAVTPVGMMTPSGVQMPNGMLNPQVVIKACVLHPGCSPVQPCALSPGCGSLVPVALVSNNATMLASALSAPGAAGGIMPAGGMYMGRMGTGMLVNPVTGQPISGLSMNGGPQVGYPPIGYTPTGYSPKYPRFDGTGAQGEEPTEEEVEQSPITKSQMPVPRFYPVPSKPAFQRSEGLPVNPEKKSGQKVSLRDQFELRQSELNDLEEFAQGGTQSGYGRKQSTRRDTDSNSNSNSDGSFNAALERAYLEGMSAAMDEVDQELEAKEQEWAQAEVQSRVLGQAKKLQDRIDRQQQERVRMVVQASAVEPSTGQWGTGTIASAVDFYPTNRPAAPRGTYHPVVHVSNDYMAGRPNVNEPRYSSAGAVREVEDTRETLLQTAKSVGNELLSPFQTLFDKGNGAKPSQGLAMRPPAVQTAYRRTEADVYAAATPATHSRPRPVEARTQPTNPTNRKAPLPMREEQPALYAEANYPVNASAPVQPLRPPTASRKILKEMEDEENIYNDTAVSQANYTGTR